MVAEDAAVTAAAAAPPANKCQTRGTSRRQCMPPGRRQLQRSLWEWITRYRCNPQEYRYRHGLLTGSARHMLLGLTAGRRLRMHKALGTRRPCPAHAKVVSSVPACRLGPSCTWDARNDLQCARRSTQHTPTACSSQTINAGGQAWKTALLQWQAARAEARADMCGSRELPFGCGTHAAAGEDGITPWQVTPSTL